MKYLFINSVVGYGSTGRLVVETCRKLIKEGHTCAVAWGRIKVNADDIPTYKIGRKIGIYKNALKSRLFDSEGFESSKATKELIKWIEEYKPDVIWLHNLHGYYLDVELLFNYIKTRNFEVKWTLHDCWAFTGHCVHFSALGCEQWKEGCHECTQLREYPACYGGGNVSKNYQNKKNAFTGVKNMQLYVPSKWLEGLVKKSFLSEYPVTVQYHEIDRSIFKNTPSDFRKIHQLDGKCIILGVASIWSKNKGLDVFERLAKELSDDYAIVLVGLNKRQKANMPKNVLCLDRTNSPEELAKIYSAADYYVNPSKEETYGLTTAEALACGTPAIVYRETASEEVAKMYGGIAIDPCIDEIIKNIKNKGAK